MDDKLSEIAVAWCIIMEGKLQLVKDAAAHGYFDTAALKDMNDAAENLGFALDWLPVQHVGMSE